MFNLFKKKEINTMTREEEQILNRNVIKQYNIGDRVTVLRGNNKGFEGVIKFISITGGDRWVKFEIFNSKKKKKAIVETPDMYKFDKEN